jgi:predicted HTH domain antitoxin
MNLSIEVPDDLVEQLQLVQPEANRRVLESLALEAYRAGNLSRGKLSELLGLSFWDAEALLKERGCAQGLTWAEVEQDVEKLRKFLGR